GNSSGTNVSLNGVHNGLTSINTGNGPSSVNLSGVSIGTANINTGSGNSQVAVSGPAVGNLSINAGATGQTGNASISVTNTQIGHATINVSGAAQNGGVQSVNISGNTFTSNPANAANNFGALGGAIPLGGLPVSSPAALTVNVGQNGVPSSYNVNISNNAFNTGAP